MTGTTTPPAIGAGEVCRLTIHGPDSRVELAVPTHIPLDDLLPTLLEHLGSGLGTAGLDHGGWVLQRLGEAPLDESQGTAALGLYDGDALYLRPRNDQLPPVDFDDLADGVATGVAELTDTWRPAATRRLLLGLVGVCLALALLLVPMTGPGPVVAAAAGAVALLLVAGASAASRSLGDGTAALLLSAGSIAFATVTGLALPAVDRLLFDSPGPLSAPSVLAAGACAAVVAMLSRVAVGTSASGYLAATLSAVLIAGGGLLCAVGTMTAGGSAAIVLTATLVLGTRIPALAARMAGLQLPPLPTTAEQFQQDIDPDSSTSVLARTKRADRHVTSLFTGLGVVAAGCLVVLAFSAGWASPTLASVASLLLVLHARELRSTGQRLAVLVPGIAGLAMVLIALCMGLAPLWRMVIAGGLLVVAGLLFAGARRLPGRILLPHWGRAGDWSHSALAISIIPLVLAALDLYSRVRAGWS